MAEQVYAFESDEDFTGFFAYFRKIDISESLGGNRNGDPKGKGQHLQIGAQFGILVVFSVVYWLTYYLLYKCLKQKKYEEYIPNDIIAKRMGNHIISSMHAFYSVFTWLQMVLVSCRLPGKTFFSEFECLDYTSPMMELLMLISLSYFLNDGLTLRHVFGNNGRTNQTYVHHLICIVGVSAALIIGRAVGVVIQCIFITEISTIFVNFRYIMKDMKIDGKEQWKGKFFVNGLCLNITFFLSRVVFLTILLAMYIVPTLIDLDYDEAIESIGEFRVRWMQVMLGLFIVLYLMNMYWFVSIIKGSIAHMSKSKKGNKKKEEIEEDDEDKKQDEEINEVKLQEVKQNDTSPEIASSKIQDVNEKQNQSVEMVPQEQSHQEATQLPNITAPKRNVEDDQKVE